MTNQATQTMRVMHQLKPEAALDVTISSQTAILSTLSGMTSTLTGFLGFIAAISLIRGRHWRHEHHAGVGDRADA